MTEPTVVVEITKINPEPWTVPSPGIIKRGGKTIPVLRKSGGLVAYQEAIKDALENIVDLPMLEGDLSVTFYLWRRLDTGTDGDGKKRTAHVADATNMQKSTEDACQGFLYANDNKNVHVETYVVGQGKDVESRILIALGPARQLELADIPSPTHFTRPSTNLPASDLPDRDDFDPEDVF